MSLSSLNSIGQTIFELESGNENVDKQTDGQTNEHITDKRMGGIRKMWTDGQTDGRRTHQSNRRVACNQKKKKTQMFKCLNIKI